jgi:hypothetical protein
METQQEDLLPHCQSVRTITAMFGISAHQAIIRGPSTELKLERLP